MVYIASLGQPELHIPCSEKQKAGQLSQEVDTKNSCHKSGIVPVMYCHLNVTDTKQLCS